jgi:hypothetical protein
VKKKKYVEVSNALSDVTFFALVHHDLPDPILLSSPGILTVLSKL